ncbi:glycosyltransferase family 2 protein [Halomicrobium salinisoli]|uniref:glycosyltransferase family 2 protein n=1 Tax=Halomicrobium salinisoli TaxID=2878391 RepID=UPI001CF0999B|nr:glycosyltransferase [Halomicrobium salinisoli]
MSEVSVSIPCYNVFSHDHGERWLRTAIESVLEQTYEKYELLLIDDGSDDGTVALLEEYDDDGRVTVIRQENQGYPGARNTGLEEGDGEYYAFLGQDDRWEPTKLERQVAHLESEPVDVVHSNVRNVDEDGEQIGYRHEERPPQPAEPDRFVEALFERTFVCIQSVLIRASAIEGRRFDTDLPIACDIDMWLRVAGEHRFGYVPEVLVEKRYHDDNVSNDYEQSFEELRTVLERAIDQYPYLRDRRDARFSRLHYGYANNLLRDGRPEEARAQLRKALSLDSTNVRAWIALAASLGGRNLGPRLLDMGSAALHR